MNRLLTTFLLLFPIVALAQTPVKKPIGFDDFAGWKNIAGQKISDNGEIVVYEVNPQKGDGILVIWQKGRADTIPRGTGANISPDNDFVVFTIKQPEETVRKAKIDKVKKDDMPADSVGIFTLKDHSIVKYPNLKSFKIPEKNATWLAILLKHTAQKDTTKANDEKPKNKKVEQEGDDLVLFYSKSGDTLMFSNTTDYNYPKYGGNIFFINRAKDTLNTFSKVRWFNAETREAKSLFESVGWSEKITSDDNGKQVAFLHSSDTIKEKVFKLYYGTIAQMASEMIVDSHSAGMPVGWSPSKDGEISFSADGTKLYFGTSQSPKPAPKDTIPDDEKPKLDIWNWQDPIIQPQQLAELDKEKKRTYLSVYMPGIKRYVQLADLNIRNVSTIMKGNADIALGNDDTPYLRESSWTGENNRDYYLVDIKTGIKQLLAKNRSYARLSPAGKYFIWFDDSDSSFYVKATTGEDPLVISLTQKIPVRFSDEENDTPSNPRPYGIAGWSESDRFVYIYDRYDIWKFDPTNERVPVNITKAFGRRNNTQLRYIGFDRNEEYIPVDKEVILRAFDERTMSSGFFKTSFNTVKEPDLILVDKYSFSTPTKAKNAEVLLWSKEDVKTYPDLWVSSLGFKNAEKISDANPQQSSFNWLTVEPVEWTSFTGETLKGLLYKPENFNPSKRYPMIIYFYERNSQTLHQHTVPAPIRSALNKTFMVSNGYLFFIPDITYRTGYPGQSAYDAVISGTNYLLNKYSFIDREHIGLQGHSWGGYQALYLITQTNMFAAAEAGAPVSNMISAYGGIRWTTGLSRMFQYEHTQSRIGGTLWEKPLLYIENSPLFFAEKIQTPLLMMHNDNDGSVPWYQGIEMFVAMRRLNKPAWLLNYNGEDHGLGEKSWANKMDFAKRMYQFFNHYLKNQPMPEWMKTGVPAIEKGNNPGYEE